MEKPYRSNILAKTLAFYGVFMTLYVAYKFLPVFPVNLISGVTESNFQHYKEGFYSYLIVNLVEYLVHRKQVQDRVSYVYSRLFATIILPWVIFLLWYIAPAVVGRWPNNVYEIVYANVITLLVGAVTVLLERSLETATYQRAQKTVLIILFLASILLYFVFTYQLPWADVFVEPNWR